jgi:hypothetical protein
MKMTDRNITRVRESIRLGKNGPKPEVKEKAKDPVVDKSPKTEGKG